MPKLSEFNKKQVEELKERARKMRENGMIIADIMQVLEKSYGWVWKALNDKQ